MPSSCVWVCLTISTEASLSGSRGNLSMLALGFPLSSDYKEELKLAQIITLPGSSTF